MTRLLTLPPHRVIDRFPATVLTVLLTIALVALITTAPAAAALRTGPDIALQVGAGTGAAVPTGYVPPVAGVDPPSGVERRFDAPAERWGAGHRGVDLTAPHGSSVLSPGPGVVTFAGQVARRGVMVVTHPDGLRSSLEPVTASVAVGTTVTAGERIGTVEGGHAGGGTTSSHCAPRSCLHWGVRRGERYLDPLSLLYRPPIVLLPDR
ncbi:Peptidase family M23 [Promicromonospora umidemergens]|uniref:M23ase beta-sheet core domain-containing protein n=1 Tax=Promicromonospora umidemergens TaxID=629679 RepID=A0ABP8XE99_9MICO|nr:M23 family metallopeptidase [Promicromonospora umidemergens]MCP2282969.1 Peptidase family M23 [Promicromonospora umidemergens]